MSFRLDSVGKHLNAFEPEESIEKGKTVFHKLVVVQKVSFFLVCIALLFLPVGRERGDTRNSLMQAEICIAFIGFFGVAHGSLDYLYFPKESGPKVRHPALIASYAIFALVVFLFWNFFPVPTFLLFLVFSILHFAGLDLDYCRKLRQLNEIRTRDWFNLSLAGLSIFSPCALMPEQASSLIMFLIPERTAFWAISRSLVCVGWFWLFASAGLVLIASLKVSRGQFIKHCVMSSEVVFLCFLAARVSPLVVFTIYFCLLHALKETLQISFKLDAKDLRYGFLQFLKLSALPTLIVLVLAAVQYLLLCANGECTKVALVKTLFITLSCVSIPHVAFRFFTRSALWTE